MYASEFEYASPTSLASAISMLARHGDDAKVIAGGQSLVPMMNLRLLQPGLLIDLGGLPVPKVRIDGDWLVLPAGTTHERLTRDPLVAQHAPMVAQCARHIGNVRVRTRGTVAGSIAHADPAAELPCVLTALGAHIDTEGPDGRRAIVAGDFFLTYLTTALEQAELVTDVRVPVQAPRSGQAFVEFARRANDFAVVEAAAVVRLDRRQRCRSLALVLGGVQDTPMDATTQALRVLQGARPSDEAFAEIGRQVRAHVRPPDDVHGTAAYRSHLVESLTRRVLKDAAERALGGGS